MEAKLTIRVASPESVPIHLKTYEVVWVNLQQRSSDRILIALAKRTILENECYPVSVVKSAATFWRRAIPPLTM